MAKIGRNGPCPCGSGKKYKHCCLDKPPFLFDRETLRILELLKKNEREIRTASEATRRKLDKEILRIFQNVGLDIEPNAALLRDYVGWLEKECASVILYHDPVFWLSIDRRIPGWLLIKAQAEQSPNPERSQQELSTIKTALFFKYGARRISGLKGYFDGTFGFEMSSEDIIRLFGVLRVLLDEIVNLQWLYRRMNKGAKLRIAASGEFAADPDKEMTELMLLYDQRREERSTTFSPIGFLASFRARQVFPSAELRASRWSTLDFIYNRDPDYVHEVGDNVRIKSPNFLPYQVALDCFSFIDAFEEQVEAVTGMTLRQLRLCFVALKNYLCDRWSEEVGQQATYLNRGLIFAEPTYFIERVTECLQELFEIEGDNGTAANVVLLLVDLLASRNTITRYEPLIHRGIPALYETSSLYILDLNLIVALLTNLMMDLQLDSEMKRIKGSTFEAAVASRVLSDCHAVSMPIRPGLKLKKRGEQNAFAELDAYIQVGTLLFLVDCKAYSLTREYFRGDFRAVMNRRILTNEWLDGSDRRTREIAKHPAGANYTIPKEITHLIPVVCSAFPEFWWSFDENEFLVTRKIPRVCTYHELVEVLNSEAVGDLTEKAFAIPIA